MKTNEKLLWIIKQSNAKATIQHRDGNFMIMFNRANEMPNFVVIGVKDLDAELDKIALFFGLDLKDIN